MTSSLSRFRAAPESPFIARRAPAIVPWPPAEPPLSSMTSRMSRPAFMRRSPVRIEKKSWSSYSAKASDQRMPSRYMNRSATSATMSGA